MPKTRHTSELLAIAAVAVILIAVLIAITLPPAQHTIAADESPSEVDYTTMLKYRISRLADDQIRAMKADVPNKIAEILARRQAARAKEAEEARIKFAKCDDPVWVERHIGEHTICNDRVPDLGFGGPIDPPPDPEAVFDEMVMGACEHVSTVDDARKVGCLPP